MKLNYRSENLRRLRFLNQTPAAARPVHMGEYSIIPAPHPPISSHLLTPPHTSSHLIPPHTSTPLLHPSSPLLTPLHPAAPLLIRPHQAVSKAGPPNEPGANASAQPHPGHGGTLREHVTVLHPHLLLRLPPHASSSPLTPLYPSSPVRIRLSLKLDDRMSQAPTLLLNLTLGMAGSLHSWCSSLMITAVRSRATMTHYNAAQLPLLLPLAPLFVPLQFFTLVVLAAASARATAITDSYGLNCSGFPCPSHAALSLPALSPPPLLMPPHPVPCRHAHAARSHAAPSHAAPSHATPSHATPSHATPSHATPSHATPSHATPSHATPSHATPSHATPSHAAPSQAAPHSAPSHATPCDGIPWQGAMVTGSAQVILMFDGSCQ
ncbi:unnamed protein product [Closterium sp. NIES-65]|nr:unnamed protein product [Closterium sp. NIES-65]